MHSCYFERYWKAFVGKESLCNIQIESNQSLCLILVSRTICRSFLVYHFLQDRCWHFVLISFLSTKHPPTVLRLTFTFLCQGSGCVFKIISGSIFASAVVCNLYRAGPVGFKACAKKRGVCCPLWLCQWSGGPLRGHHASLFLWMLTCQMSAVGSKSSVFPLSCWSSPSPLLYY